MSSSVLLLNCLKIVIRLRLVLASAQRMSSQKQASIVATKQFNIHVFFDVHISAERLIMISHTRAELMYATFSFDFLVVCDVVAKGYPRTRILPFGFGQQFMFCVHVVVVRHMDNLQLITNNYQF